MEHLGTGTLDPSYTIPQGSPNYAILIIKAPTLSRRSRRTVYNGRAVEQDASVRRIRGPDSNLLVVVAVRRSNFLLYGLFRIFQGLMPEGLGLRCCNFGVGFWAWLNVRIAGFCDRKEFWSALMRTFLH